MPSKKKWPPDHLVWVDIETTGLDPITDVILEVGLTVTSPLLERGAARNWIINPGIFPEMSGFVLKMHQENGLLDDVADLNIAQKPHEVNNSIMGWLKEYSKPGISPMCGSSVHFDRKFLAVHFPEIEEFFHYRNLDISTLKIANDIWEGEPAEQPEKKAHRALADIRESIREAGIYKDQFFTPGRVLIGADPVTAPTPTTPPYTTRPGSISPGTTATWSDATGDSSRTAKA